MKNVQLVRLSPALQQALASDANYQEALAQSEWPRVAGCVLRLTGRNLDGAPAGAGKSPWGEYIAVDSGTREVVGSCAFKRLPNGEGSIEIAYFTYPGFESRGYATGMALHLIELARETAEAQSVIAHTLPQASASTRVLQKVGMRFAGEAIDPNDGHVWRWKIYADG